MPHSDQIRNQILGSINRFICFGQNFHSPGYEKEMFIALTSSTADMAAVKLKTSYPRHSFLGYDYTRLLCECQQNIKHNNKVFLLITTDSVLILDVTKQKQYLKTLKIHNSVSFWQPYWILAAILNKIFLPHTMSHHLICILFVTYPFYNKTMCKHC